MGTPQISTTSPTTPILSPISLSYEQEKLIKKELLSLQVNSEFTAISQDFSIRPFLSTQSSQHTLKQYPFLSLIFHRFVRTFPFTARTNNEAEFWEKVELFMQETAKRRFSSSAERAEATKRKELMRRLKSLVVWVSAQVCRDIPMTWACVCSFNIKNSHGNAIMPECR